MRDEVNNISGSLPMEKSFSPDCIFEHLSTALYSR